MLQTPHKSTPKRKRDENLSLSPIKFSFELSTTAEIPEDGSNSPRSKVAHKFRGLALQGGGGASSHEPEMADDDAARKRQRPDEQMRDVDIDIDIAAHVPRVIVMEEQDASSITAIDTSNTIASEPQPSTGLRIGLTGSPRSDNTAIKITPELNPDLHRAYPSTNRSSDPKSRSRVKKRVSSPPLRAKRMPQPEDDNDDDDDYDDEDEDEDQVVIFDPIRAALTWREDEITVYDPEDEDDDGTGVNGIGFKPTPALAHSRAMRRRQQMAEYRKREESEARSRRSQRRQPGSGISLAPDRKSPPRKVRFTESEAKNFAVTTI